MRHAAAVTVLLLAACTAPRPTELPRLHYVTTAQQLGPVSYRDPLGVLSPDGQWLAYSVQQHLYVQRAAGGPVRTLPEKPGLILHLAWLPDSRGIAAQHRFASPSWYKYDRDGASPVPLWSAEQRMRAAGDTSASGGVALDSLVQLAWSLDGHHVAGIRNPQGGSALWVWGDSGSAAQVTPSSERLSFPAIAPDGHVACLSSNGTRQALSEPCGVKPAAGAPAAYGPLAFTSTGDTLYYAAPDSGRGTLDLWRRAGAGATAVRLASFGRDTYAPTVARDGTVLFKVQMYRTVVGVLDSAGAPVREIAGFQSETPSWDPSGKWIGITYGTWRRAIDDINYPDIAQDNGIISASPDSLPRQPARIVDASPSEDQSLAWSPNGKWIVYHSHKDLGDDLYVVPADLSAKARRITTFGRAFETGWPRWSPDGKRVVFDAASRSPSHRSVIYVMGLDQETGQVTAPEREVALQGFSGEAIHAEWLPGNRLAVLGLVADGVDAAMVVPAAGGAVRTVHTWKTGHKFAGLGASPDGKYLAFIGPAADGHFQVFRIPVAGGAPVQLTFDPTNKTQPSYAPDGRRIALTVFEYSVQFWTTAH